VGIESSGRGAIPNTELVRFPRSSAGLKPSD
jgi:hypothetical protein